MKRVLAIGLAAAFLISASIASALHRNSTRAAQGSTQTLTEVKVCPMNGEVLSDVSSAPNEVVGNYKVYFCCEHHKEAFSKLPQKEKEQKIAAALAKQNKSS
jgi:hypothetical protein